jgi:hypothetical protein
MEYQSLQSQPVLQKSDDLPMSVAISSGITLAVTGFAAKWMFAQIVSYWQQQIQDLKTGFLKLDRDLTEFNEKYDALREDLATFRCEIPQHYVSREDWIRSTVAVENKIDRMAGRIDDKFDRLIERLPMRGDEK